MDGLMQHGEMAMKIRKRGWVVIGLALAAAFAGGLLASTVLDSTEGATHEVPRVWTAAPRDATAWECVPPIGRSLWEMVFRGAR
jgi:hypothetical protein